MSVGECGSDTVDNVSDTAIVGDVIASGKSNASSDRVTILGIPIDVTDMRGAVDTIAGFICSGGARYVCACDVHSLMRAQDDPAHMASLCAAALVLPDGMPLVWVGRMRGKRDMVRVCGPDLMLAVCERSVREGWRHYFMGGAEGTADLLRSTLLTSYPGLDVAGTHCPSFGPQTLDEIGAAIAKIKNAKPHIVWVGLGCPKQEFWMFAHRSRLDGIVLIGVGAAFDFNSGRTRRAPRWMQSWGLEWLHRLASEPRRLWRRYLVVGPRFGLAVARESLLLPRKGGTVIGAGLGHRMMTPDAAGGIRSSSRPSLDSVVAKLGAGRSRRVQRPDTVSTPLRTGGAGPEKKRAV